MPNIEMTSKWRHALEAGKKIRKKLETSDEITREWDAQMSVQVFRQKHGVTMYWERGHKPDIYAQGQSNRSLKEKLKIFTRCVLEAAMNVFSKKKSYSDIAQHESGGNLEQGVETNVDGVGYTADGVHLEDNN
ncbi:uncharacterized protein ARMOST_15222 [Armillaria ostoyae]|uniref:Uncharacterized protein n=1 Tax=Armillaria ostoyae TaxID=47428 RepID=A0A284RST5_ARMOS|nr:uncharacterized protein ARMOST_15222 [Armillaria ostoyae]